MKELEEVGFDNVVSNDFKYQTKWLKYYTKYSIVINKFDNIYSGKENFIKEYKEYYYNENGVELTDDDIEFKKELAKGICEDFFNFCNENDFTKLSIEELQERLNKTLFIK